MQHNVFCAEPPNQRSAILFYSQRVEACLMSISKRILTFVFTAITAYSFLATGELVAQQQYSGLKMAPGHFVGPELKGNPTKEQRREWNKKYGPAKKRVTIGVRKVKEVLAAGGNVKSDPEARQFLETVTFPGMTQADLTLSNLGEKRQKFLNNFLDGDVTGVARGNMIDFTIETLQNYCINTSLHPSARINAVVLMSQLTDRPLIPRVQAPRASGRAFNVLQKIFNGKNEKQFPEYLKIAAFAGMKNQLEMNSKAGQPANANVRGPLVEAVMKILPVEADPEKDAAGYWKKRLAVQFAGVLEDVRTLPGLLAILNDEASSFELKMDVVKTLAKTGSMANDPKNNGTVVAAISQFAAKAIDSEATNITAAHDKIIRDNMLYGGIDLKQRNQPVDFQPAGADGSDRRPDAGSANRPQEPIIELPNYLLGISRNRIRAVAFFSRQAINTTSQQGGLDPKAKRLGDGCAAELNSLLEKANVGLVDVEVRPRDGEQTPQEKDLARQTSYVDQMIEVCKESVKTLNGQLETYSAE